MPWKDPEKTKAAGKRWYEANKEKKAAQDKRRQNTPEFKKANRVRALAYYHANRDKVLSYKKKFHAANLESQRARMRNRVISPEQRNRYNAQARAGTTMATSGHSSTSSRILSKEQREGATTNRSTASL